MDAITKKFIVVFACWFCYSLADAQQMNWNRLTEDTIYFGKDYLPDLRMLSMTGPAQIWDFRSLKAPYALSRRIVQSGERDGKMLANLVNGKLTDAILHISDKGTQVIQVIENNPVCHGGRLSFMISPAYKPFFTGVLGEKYTYRGKMISSFAWPRDITCVWTPPQLPDSCRVTVSIAEEIVIDGEGTLYLPTEIASVYRHKVEIKRAYKVEIKNGKSWRDVTSLVPGIRLLTTTSLVRFVSASTGIPLAEIVLNSNEEPLSIEFKTHPMVTRIFTEEPSKPDIYAYPNPSYDIVRFQLADLAHGLYKLQIFNILGVPVKEVDIKVDDRRETIALDLGEMQRGTYLFRLQDRVGRTVKTKRFVLIQS